MQKTKMVDGKELTAHDFAYVGDPEDPETWKLPIHDEAHARNALARFNQTDLPADAKAEVARRLLAAAKRFGIDASGFADEHKAMMGSRAPGPWYAVSQAAQFLAEEGAGSDDGYTWPVQVIEAGPAQGALIDDSACFVPRPHMFTPEVVAQFAAAANNARFGRRHPQAFESEDDPERIAGWFTDGAVVGNAARARMHLLKNEQALRDKLMAAKEAGKLDLFGLSVLAYVAFRAETQQGSGVLISEKLGKLVSIDLVTEAGAGGKFLVAASKSLAAGLRELGSGLAARESAVGDRIAQLRKNAGLSVEELASAMGVTVLKLKDIEDGDIDPVPEELVKAAAKKLGVHFDFLNKGTGPAKEAAAAGAAGTSSGTSAQAGRTARGAGAVSNGTARATATGRNLGGANMKDRILKVLETLRKFDAGRADELTRELEELPEERHIELLAKVTESLDVAQRGVDARASEILLGIELRSARITLGEKIAEAKLPAEAGKLVRDWFNDRAALGHVSTEVEIEAQIKKTREAFAKFSPIGKLSEGAVMVGRDSTEKVQLAFDAMLGVKAALADKTVQAFHGIRDAYVFVTGDRDMQFGFNGRGGFTRVAEATVLTSDFPNLLLNSLTKRLIQDYAEAAARDGLDYILTSTDVADFKSQDRVRVGYLADLATVAEDAAYVDFAKPTDEKISYTATKRGNTLPVSRETILNDDLGKIAVFPQRIARAGRRTLKQFASNFFVNNTAYGPDTLAWFHATHANLGAAELSVDELVAREVALYNQTEKDSAKPLGLPLQWLMVSISRKAVAHKINQAQFYNPGPNIQEPNPFYQRFGANNERIIVNELLPTANPKDWYYGTSPDNAPFLEVGFVQGVRQPQIFLQSDAQAGVVFTNDRITYKVRHEYGGAIVDFRGVGKNVVP